MQSYLYVLAVINVWINVGCDEVGVVGEPTHNENDHYHYHHLDNLDKWNLITLHNKDWKQKNKKKKKLKSYISYIKIQCSSEIWLFIIYINGELELTIIIIIIININICWIQTFLLDLILSVWASVASPIDLLPQSSSPTL